MSVYWLTCTPSGRAHPVECDDGRTGWRRHAVVADATETFGTIGSLRGLCGLVPKASPGSYKWYRLSAPRVIRHDQNVEILLKLDQGVVEANWHATRVQRSKRRAVAAVERITEDNMIDKDFRNVLAQLTAEQIADLSTERRGTPVIALCSVWAMIRSLADKQLAMRFSRAFLIRTCQLDELNNLISDCGGKIIAVSHGRTTGARTTDAVWHNAACTLWAHSANYLRRARRQRATPKRVLVDLDWVGLGENHEALEAILDWLKRRDLGAKKPKRSLKARSRPSTRQAK